jgi:DeoR family transcriptional regulator of aga operon
MRELAIARRRRIETYIRSDGNCRVTELSRQLGVSQATIRRDLAELEALGSILRVNGGAVSRERLSTVEPRLVDRELLNADCKRRIGRLAADIVGEGETIMIASGTTTLELARSLIGKRGINVVTNALNVAFALSASPDINLVVLGGYLRQSENSVLGHLAEQNLQGLHAHKLFVGAFGLDAHYGLSGDHMPEVRTDRAMISAASKVVVLADHTKLGRKGVVQVAPATDIDMLITDSDADAHQIDALKEIGIDVSTA